MNDFLDYISDTLWGIWGLITILSILPAIVTGMLCFAFIYYVLGKKVEVKGRDTDKINATSVGYSIFVWIFIILTYGLK